MHILISPNAFKNSLDAEDAALAIQEGIKLSRLKCTSECFPVGDGGDGSADLIIKKCKGDVVPTRVRDPLGRIINTSFGLIDAGRTAVIEMANASGLRLLSASELDPLATSSYGTGEQMRIALNKGVRKIIIGMGGSATIDGGTGILEALGARFLNADNTSLSRLPENLPDLASIDLSGMDPRIYGVEIVVLCDVDNSLLGANGAAAMFGPQKGASGDAIDRLDTGLAKLAAVSFEHTGRNMAGIKYGGTAGGASAGLYALLQAKLENGINYLLDLTNFNAALAHAHVVITGEGCIDEQTLQGKGPFGVAYRARKKGIPVIGIAGKVPLSNSEILDSWFDVLLSIGQQPMDMQSAISLTKHNLVRSGKLIGNLLAINEQLAVKGDRLAVENPNVIRWSDHPVK